MNLIKRRRFLTLSMGTAGAALLAQCRRNPVTPFDPQVTSAAVFTSRNGLLEAGLVARLGTISLGEQQGNLMAYNGQIPGPRLEVNPGDTVRIHFKNQLAQVTNLHYHGLHIPPTGSADNIFLSIPAGESYNYEFTIPKDHPAGTFYYHPHIHELVAEQIFAGLGGIFVVRGELDEIPEIKAAQEEFIFLKDFAFDRTGQVTKPGHMALMRGREGDRLTVNGQINPRITIPAKGLLRLRFVNASASRFYRLKLEEHPFYLIATDGGAIGQPLELDELLLSPGERAEVLIQGNRPAGQYRLLDLPYDRGGMMGGMMGRGMMGRQGASVSDQVQAIATMIYQGSVPQPVALPNKLIPVATLPPPSRTRRIEMSMSRSMGREMGMGMTFRFNNQTFDMDRVDAAVKLGTTEEWELVNVDPDGMEHPFHLHTNAFQVISRNDQPEADRAWKDTIRVQAKETVRIRIPFRDFSGKTVYHCHILDHEDLGMMGMVEMQA